MVRRWIAVALFGPAALFFGPALHAGDPQEKGGEKAGGKKAETGFLPAYFKIWKSLGKDELKGVPEAKEELVASLEASGKTAPEGLAEKDRAQRAKLIASAKDAAAKLDTSDLKKAREGFGALSVDLRKFVEAFPAEADAYVVYCDMAKKSWLQDSPKVFNPYYGSSMSGCGKVVRKPASAKTFYCPMHAAVRSPKPGSCPTCRMKLVPVPEN